MARSTKPFRYFGSSPEVNWTVVMMYAKCPLSLRNVEDLLAEHGIDICYETVRLWRNRFGPMFAAESRRKRVQRMRSFTHWGRHLDEEVGRWANNRLENSHLPFRRRERAMVRFRQMKTLQKFGSAHAAFHNHVNQDRHLISRETYKAQRSAALAEWKTLAG